MLDVIIARVLEVAEGQKLAPLLAKRTGVSEPTFRKPVDEVRPSTKHRIREASRSHMLQRLRQQDWPERDAQRWLDEYPETAAANLVYGTQDPHEPQFPATLDLAQRIDGLGIALLNARRAQRFDEAKSLLVETSWLGDRYFAASGAEWSEETVPKARRLAADAREWRDLDTALTPVTLNALFSLLALWDVELGRDSLSRLAPTPIFKYLMPAFKGVIGQPLVKKRDIVRYPVRRLIDLVAALAHLHKTKRWPAKPIPVTDLVAACELAGAGFSATAFAKWRGGEKPFPRRAFEQYWTALFPPRHDSDRVPPMVPLYFAATIFQLLLVKNDEEFSLLILDDDYVRWWEHHNRERQAKDAEVGEHPWPAWLTDA